MTVRENRRSSWALSSAPWAAASSIFRQPICDSGSGSKEKESEIWKERCSTMLPLILLAAANEERAISPCLDGRIEIGMYGGFARSLGMVGITGSAFFLLPWVIFRGY